MTPRRDAAGRSLLLLAALGLAALLPGAAATQERTDTAQARAAPPPRDTVAGSLRGQVVSDAGGPVPGARLEIRSDDGPARSVLADDRGRYRLEGLPPGRWLLRVTALDHALFEAAVRVPAGTDVELDVVLTLRPVALPDLDAVGRVLPLAPDPSPPRDDGGQGTDADPGLRALEAGPGAAGLGRLLQGLRPGPPSDPGSVLYVRGAATDLKRVFLDGAPVYAPFHLGGLLESVPPGVVGDARLYTGGAPVAYDGGLSYVLDLRTRPGEGGPVDAGGHLDLLGAAARAEGSTGRFSYLVSGRSTHDAASHRLLDGELPYGYREALGRADLALSDDHHLAFTGFANRESARLEGGGGPREASWGNVAGSLRWATRVGSTRALLTAAAGRFTSRLPLSVESGARSRSRTTVSRLALDMTTDRGGVELDYGAALLRHVSQVELPAHLSSGGVPTDPLRWRGRSASLAAYGAATFHPWSDVDLRAGLRGTLHDGGLAPSPRLAFAWRASEETRLELSAGRYHQTLGAPESTLSGDLDEWAELLRREADSASPSDEPALGRLASASASHLTVRMDHRARDDLELGLEGFFKTFHGLTPAGDVHASGADLWLDWEGDRWAARAGYSLAWTWADPPAAGEDRSFSGRQLLSVAGRAPLPSGLRLDARVRASWGLPFTRVPLSPEGLARESGAPTFPSGESRDGGPLLAGPPDGSYLRLDLTLSKVIPAGVFGGEASLRPYLRVLNALDRRDALFYQLDPGGQLRPRALDSLPVLPVVGLEWSVE